MSPSARASRAEGRRTRGGPTRGSSAPPGPAGIRPIRARRRGSRRPAGRSTRHGRAAPGRAACGAPGRRRGSGPAPGEPPRRPRPRGTRGPAASRRSRSSSAPSATTAGASVPWRATSWATTVWPQARIAGMVASSRRDPGLGARVGGTDQPPVGGLAPPRRRRVGAEHGIDDVERHDPVGRVLAAADPHHAVRLDGHPVLARRLDRRAVGRRDQRPEPRVRPDHVVPAEVHRHRRVDRCRAACRPPSRRPSGAPPAPRTARRSCRSASARATGRGRRSCPAPGSSDPSCWGSARAGRRGGRRGSAGSGATRPERMVGLGRPDTGRVHDRPRRDLEIAAVEQVRRTHGLHYATHGVGADAGRPDPGDDHGTGRHRGPRHGERVARVVLDRVVVEQSAAQAARAGASAPGRGSRRASGGDASRRRGARRGCRTASGRRRRTPSTGTAGRRSGTGAARGGRGAAPG